VLWKVTGMSRVYSKLYCNAADNRATHNRPANTRACTAVRREDMARLVTRDFNCV
jgi:hypothetical protein